MGEVIGIVDYLLDRYHSETMQRDSYPLDSPQRRDCEARIARLGRQLESELGHRAPIIKRPEVLPPPTAA